MNMIVTGVKLLAGKKAQATTANVAEVRPPVDPELIANKAISLFQDALENVDTALNVIYDQRQTVDDQIAGLAEVSKKHTAQAVKLTTVRSRLLNLLGEED